MSEGTQRRLAAIVSADVVGYSRLIGVDETGTLAALRAHRAELIDPLIAEHGGRIVKTMGDGLLLEFPSVVNATQCVLEVQRTMVERNEGIEENRRITFRVGINLGDIVTEGDDIHGDGVNVAARLQENSAPGGLALSGIAYEGLGSLVDAAVEAGGQHQFKNIARSIQVWRWSPYGSTAAPAVATTSAELQLPDKPSIAVLPFDNMSGDPEQEYFADGISEDIITALSKFRWFFVSARNSTFAYRGTAINIKQIGQELNVRYVLEGSVRKAGKRVRITAQLIEAQSGNHIWADRYDRDLEDIFDLQDEIQQAIVAAVEPELVSAEFQRASKKSSDDLAAWDLLQQAMWHLNQRNEEDTSRAVKLFEETIARDSSMARAYSGYSRTLINMIGYGWSRKPEEHLRKTKELALEAVRKDDSDPFNHDALGRVFSFHNDPENAIREHRIALKLNPNSAYTHWGLAEALRMADRHEEALTHLEEAIRLSPRDSLLFMTESYKGLSLESLGRIQEAENAFLRGVSLRPDVIWMTMLLVDFYVRHERLTDARELVERASPRLPDLSLSYARNSINPHISLRGENLIENLRAAGLPD